MTKPELLRETGCGPLGSSGTSSSPDNTRIPKTTPGTVGINDAFSRNVIYRDFTPAQQAIIKRAVKLALRKVGEAKVEISAAKNKPSAQVMSYFKITGLSLTDNKNLDVILANYNIIAGALLGHDNLVLDAEKTGPFFGLGKLIGKDVVAYVSSLVRPVAGEEGVVNMVMPKIQQMNIENLARVLIHEVSHRYIGALDEVNLWEGGVGKMDVATAMRNADTYVYFALPRPLAASLKVKALWRLR